MLYFSLTLSAVLLLIANWSVQRARHPGTVMACSCAVFLIGPSVLGCILPAVALQALLLCGAAGVWRWSRRGPSFFLPLSCGATLIAYGLAWILVLHSEREYARLRDLYPYESMADRLPAPQAVPGGNPLLPATAARLSRQEERFPEQLNGWRESQLRRLHENAVELFIDSPGFGIARMFLPTESGLAVNLRREPVPLQPGSRFASVWSPGELQRLPDDDEAPLRLMLEDGILDFINPRGFGYFKDRRHVTGFETHRFSRVPTSANRWEVRTLELVSLLLHEEPEVYVSSHLPRMDRLHGVPTRPLDRFEGFGLNALRQGEDLFTTRVEDGVRMLGAVRSTRQCVACHGGERGALLGAFSYNLRPVGR
jgi:hypothetical protein